ncbi:MAG TPA: hypothetical protein P5338_11665, partial [Bacteroidales bacterium]|nr:hypothetical protein [Bacteroidales bacterium]
MKNRHLLHCVHGDITVTAILLIQWFFALSVTGQPLPEDTSSVDKVMLNQWLKVPVSTSPAPLFGEQENLRKKVFSDEELLRSEPFPVSELYPEAKELFQFLPGSRWEPVSCDSTGVLLSSLPSDTAGIAWLATYLHAGRWLTGSLDIKGAMLFSVWLDGKSLGDKTRAGTDEKPG